MGREVDARARRVLQELRAALSRAISRSPEAEAALKRAREEGFEIHLLVDRERESLGGGPTAPDPARSSLSASDTNGPLGEALKREAAFRINASDLFFLRSIGIDPTRRVRPAR